MTGALLLAAQLALGGTLGWALAGKVRNRAAFATFRASLPRTVGVPAARAGALAVAVLAAEALTVAALLAAVTVPALAPTAFALATGLFAAFTVAVAGMVRRGVREPCRCFGVTERPPGPAHVIRNLLLTAVALGGAALAFGGVRPPSPPTLTADPTGGDMTLTTVLLLVVTVLCLVNTTVLLVVLAQLRRQSTLLKVSIEGVENPEPIMLTAGATIGDFTATTVDGTPVSRAGLRGETLVAFLSPSCPACAESLPGFVARAEAIPGGRAQALAVVLGAGEAATQLCERLTPVARVVNEPERGPVARAFGVDGYPAFGLLSDDTVIASHFVLDRVPATSAP
ncbi:redoxin domain-containing protein [Micromonospora fiedleri]|uniref:Redoxin domain-containing protein n=1 Tax=Micromonospora fiedleri TaxID=1157498 RepID=A0ABS1ULS8_9ACTN|nr:MauE/DoxX family redox-associated membrane protein [Micromonospora fiedleri]MBL6277301.1 redoxin domain-containing protein [Micromonospora fiedleri]